MASEGITSMLSSRNRNVRHAIAASISECVKNNPFHQSKSAPDYPKLAGIRLILSPNLQVRPECVGFISKQRAGISMRQRISRFSATMISLTNNTVETESKGRASSRVYMRARTSR